MFGHDQMVICASGHLRQVRDGQHLSVVTQLFHESTHRFRDRAPDAGVHFVEDQGLSGPQLACRDRNGERDA